MSSWCIYICGMRGACCLCAYVWGCTSSWCIHVGGGCMTSWCIYMWNEGYMLSLCIYVSSWCVRVGEGVCLLGAYISVG